MLILREPRYAPWLGLLATAARWTYLHRRRAMGRFLFVEAAMAGGDWFRVYRKAEDSQAFQDEGLWKVWSWCLMRANWRETWVSVKTGRGATTVHLLPGQFIYGRKEAAKALRMPGGTVRHRMDKLVKMQNLAIQAATHYSIVTVCNWETYQNADAENGQASGQPKANQRPTKGQPKATEEEGKEQEEGKDKKRAGRNAAYPPDFESFWLAVSKHKRKGKADAFRRHCEAVKLLGSRESDPVAFLLNRATAYYASPLGKTPYCHQPAVWLNKGGYDDDPASWQRSDSQRAGPGQRFPDDADQEGKF